MSLLKSHKLNERQCEILASKNLPTKWRKLSFTQREAITAIEEMLQYVEAKYNKKFCYNGYTAKNALFGDEEALFTYAEGDDPATSTFSVERTEDGFTDGYAWVTQAPIVQADIEERFGKIFAGETYKIFAAITGVADDGHVKAVDIYLYIENTSEEKIEKSMDLVAKEVDDDKIYYDFTLYWLKDGFLSKMDKKNHKDCFEIDDIIDMYLSSRIYIRDTERGWVKDE